MPNRATRENSPYRERSERLIEALRAARLGADLSQQELAERARVSIGTVRAIETGRTVEPGYFTVLALAETLHLDLATAWEEPLVPTATEDP